MAKFTSGASLGLTTQEFQVCRLIANGVEHEDILGIVYKVWKDKTPESEYKNAERKLRNLCRKENFQACYTGLVRENAQPKFSHAMNKLFSQVDSRNEWVANKASNDVVNKFWPVFMGQEEQQITVRIEGMPELGVPDADDND